MKMYISILAVFLVAFASCTKKEGTQAKGYDKKKGGIIKIGVAGAHSGDLASYGLPSVHAAELVAEEFNKAGGVMGQKIVLVIEDDECKPETATSTASKLVSDGVVAVMGHICSGATESALGVYVDTEMVTISPSATLPSLTQSQMYPSFFRTISADNDQAKVSVEFIVEELGLKSIAVLHDKGAYGQGFAELVKEYAEAKGVAVALYEGVNPGAPDYSSVVNKIQNSKVEGVVWGGYHPEGSKIVQQMRDKGMNQAFISDDGLKDNAFIEVAGKYAEGVYATGPSDTSNNPMAIKAVQDHIAKYGDEPGAFFLNAYAATWALLNAIDIAESTDSFDIQMALRMNYVETPLGNISFDYKGDVIGFGYSMFQVQNGAYVELQ